MNFRVNATKRSTYDLTTATSFQHYVLFQNEGMITHLAFDITGQTHIAVAAGPLSAITIDAVWNGIKIVDGMTIQQALAFADHFGGACTYNDETGIDGAGEFAARFSLPIGQKFLGENDKLEVTVTCTTDMHGAAATATVECGPVNHYAVVETGLVRYSRRDMVLGASAIDEKLIADKGLFAVFLWQGATDHLAKIEVPQSGTGFMSEGSPGIFRAAQYADAKLSAYGSSTFWNRLLRVWSGRGNGLTDSVKLILTADATGQTTPIFGVSVVPAKSRRYFPPTAKSVITQQLQEMAAA